MKTVLALPAGGLRADAGQCWKGPFHQHFQGPRLGGRIGEAWLIPSDCVQTVVQQGLLITCHLENHVTSLQPSSGPTQVNSCCSCDGANPPRLGPLHLARGQFSEREGQVTLT